MNKLKEALKNNKITLGTWIQISHPSIVEIIAHNCNGKLDWMCIDMEHGSINIESMTNLIRTIEKYNIIPVVRIPKNDYIWIHRALDAGAKGLVIPMIKNGQEASEAVSEALYPPLGKRSFGYSRANIYGSNFEEYIKEFNNEISIILQIEHIKAVENLEFILEIPHIDATFVGPLDLAGSLGKINEKNKNLVNEKLNYYLSESNKIGIPTGYHIIKPSKLLIEDIKAQGYKMIAIGIDVVFLSQKCNEIFG